MFCGFWVFLFNVYLFFNFLFLLFSQVFSSLRYKASGKGIHLPPPSGCRPPCPWRFVPPVCLKDPDVLRPFRWVLHPVLRSGGRSQCASPTCPSIRGPASSAALYGRLPDAVAEPIPVVVLGSCTRECPSSSSTRASNRRPEVSPTTPKRASGSGPLEAGLWNWDP